MARFLESVDESSWGALGLRGKAFPRRTQKHCVKVLRLKLDLGGRILPRMDQPQCQSTPCPIALPGPSPTLVSSVWERTDQREEKGSFPIPLLHKFRLAGSILWDATRPITHKHKAAPCALDQKIYFSRRLANNISKKNSNTDCEHQRDLGYRGNGS